MFIKLIYGSNGPITIYLNYKNELVSTRVLQALNVLIIKSLVYIIANKAQNSLSLGIVKHIILNIGSLLHFLPSLLSFLLSFCCAPCRRHINQSKQLTCDVLLYCYFADQIYVPCRSSDRTYLRCQMNQSSE